MPDIDIIREFMAAGQDLFPASKYNITDRDAVAVWTYLCTLHDLSRSVLEDILRAFNVLVDGTSSIALPESRKKLESLLSRHGTLRPSDRMYLCPCDGFTFTKGDIETTCPECGETRKAAVEAFVCFDFTLQLSRLFGRADLVALLEDHIKLARSDGDITASYDTDFYRSLRHHPDFVSFFSELHNLVVAMGTDGGLVASGKWSSTSWWPHLFFVLNARPALRFNPAFRLSLGVSSGNHSLRGHASVMRALARCYWQSWFDNGIPVFDITRDSTFNCRVLIWGTIQDGKARAETGGRRQGGYSACDVCDLQPVRFEIDRNGNAVVRKHKASSDDDDDDEDEARSPEASSCSCQRGAAHQIHGTQPC
jgi:hypothetical protein